MDDDVKMVKVEVIDPGMKIRSPIRTMDEVSALEGEAKGLWKIIGKNEERKEQSEYEDGSMAPDPVINPMTREDLFGPSNTYQTKGLKKKRVAWVMDYSRNGGAEISSFTLIEIGRRCGFEIDVLTPKTKDLSDAFKRADLAVVGNMFQFGAGSMQIIQNSLFADRIPYVKYEHDGRELGRLALSRKLFGNSKLNVFISPLHYEKYRARLGCGGIVLPLAIDAGFYRPVKGIERKPDTALVCNVRTLCTWGSLQKFVNEHPKISFTVMAKDPMVRGKNVRATPMVHYKDMPKVYSAFEYLAHFLDGWKSGERIIFEAALCGCKILANDAVGHMSWKRDLTDAEGLGRWLNDAVYRFWQEADDILS
jgi:hypothetical protein